MATELAIIIGVLPRQACVAVIGITIYCYFESAFTVASNDSGVISSLDPSLDGWSPSPPAINLAGSKTIFFGNSHT
jgi:hypothetical protein